MVLRHPKDTGYAGNIFNRVVLWNQMRDNLHPNEENGFRMLAEELFELAAYKREDAKALAQILTTAHMDQYEKRKKEYDDFGFTNSDLVDALGDKIFIAIGEIAKHGYSPEEVMIKICDANDFKGSKKNADGKILKAEDFVEPEHLVA